jgi:glycine/serine hydroxymethyltransferase
MGVSEMTRFGMEPEDFGELAELVRDVVVDQTSVKARVAELRKRFSEMHYCFAPEELGGRLEELHRLV